MYCPNCGKRLPDGAVFCGYCGKQIAGKKSGHRSAVSPEAAASPEKKRSRMPKFAAAAAVLALLCLIVFIGFGMLPNPLERKVTVTFVTDTDSLSAQMNAGGTAVSSSADALSEEENASDSAGSDAADTQVSDAVNIGYVPDDQSVSYGSTAFCPAYPTRDGYVFGGWYTDEACTQEYDFSEEVTEGLTLYARWLDPDSEEAQITDAEYEEYEEVTGQIEEIYDSYTADDGYVAESDYEDVLDAVEKYVRTQESIVYYSRGEQSIYMEFACLLTYLCAIQEEGTLSDPTMQDGETLFMIEGSSEFQLAVDGLTDKITGWGALDLTVFDDAVFTIEQLKSLDAADVFIWTGHGTTAEDLHSVLYTNDTSSRENNTTYRDMIRGKEIVDTNSGYYAVTAMFILHYFPDLDECLVILNACYGGQDAYLSAAFLNKGAQAVMAYTGAVHKWYAYIMTWDVMRYLHGKGEDGIIYDLQDALSQAEDDFGDHSRVPDYLEDAIDDVYDGSYANVYDALLDESSLYRKGFFSTLLIASNETQAQIYVSDAEAYGYTLWAGIEGTVVSEENISMSDVKVSLVNQTTGGTVDTVTPEKDGSFAFDRLDGGEDNTYALTVTCDDLIVTRSISITAHQYTDIGEIELETVHVDISVKNEEGDFIYDAAVVLEDAAGNITNAAYTKESDGDRFYEADVSGGDYTIRISADGYVEAAESVHISAGTTLLTYVLEESDTVYLMSDAVYEKDYNLQRYNSLTVLGSDYYRWDIRTITFLDNLEDMPKDAWDVGGGGGSIMAWVEYNPGGGNAADYDLYIASESYITAYDCRDLFAGYLNLTEINFNGRFRTDGVTSMYRMFYFCISLTTLDVSFFDTSSVKTMYGMFYGDMELEALDVSGFDTSCVTDMGSLFYNCHSLTSLDLSGWETSQVNDMSMMLYNCSALTSIGCELEVPEDAETKLMYANTIWSEE